MVYGQIDGVDAAVVIQEPAERELVFAKQIDLNAALFEYSHKSIQVKGASDVRLYTRALIRNDNDQDPLQELSDFRSPRIPDNYQRNPARYTQKMALGWFNALEEKTRIVRQDRVDIIGRGLLCYCFQRDCLGLTLRIENKREIQERGDEEDFPPFDKGKLQEFEGSIGYRPRDDYDAKFAIQIRHTVKFLFDLITDGQIDHLTPGLIVVAGGTGSGKSQIVRGLIYHFLHERMKSLVGKQDRPHLLTVENPIEEFLIARKVYEKAIRETDPSAPSPSYPQWIQDTYGIDYTARQLLVDTPSLEQALMGDSLRQTPYLVYVGEVRTESELRTVLEFAGTGHCVITTMHAGSVLEALQRLLATEEDSTPAVKGELAQKIRALIHLEPLSQKLELKNSERAITLPALWKGSTAAIANLVADGPSSILPMNPRQSQESQCYSFGRRYFLERLMEYVHKDIGNIRNEDERQDWQTWVAGYRSSTGFNACLEEAIRMDILSNQATSKKNREGII